MVNIDTLLTLIPAGKEQAVSGPVLAERAGYLDERSLRAAIAKARAAGEIICSGGCGYYRPENMDEIMEYVQMMERHAKSCFIAIRSARARLTQISGQMYVEDLDTGADVAGTDQSA